jgi:hypothetical protein
MVRLEIESVTGAPDHILIQRSQTSLFVPSVTTPDRLGSHSTIAAAEYAFSREKAPKREKAPQTWDGEIVIFSSIYQSIESIGMLAGSDTSLICLDS